ncbi:GNAT family N-acetyltransferase [Flagellimonas sp. CMM7]|uniref:GNAT family N-acetyltransferase n=1 Tax=Flagellimonas sp. CMM7 TaxID=2654676 RepID=UPI0013D17DB3|nr:GNAT family N-acetyltransferase [Flagellimonas sp. CMM7]UII78460.1 GNAT family N-acetyltransferase [Flagellimonas sp. CMM7]
MNFDLQPILENDLVRLRPLLSEDFDLLYKVASDQLVWEQHPDNKRYTLSGFTNFFNESIASKGAIVIIEKQSGNVIGSSRFNLVPKYKEAVEIGWTFLSRAYWGGKFNSVCKQLMMNYAFQFVNEIVFFVDKNNIRSQKAVEKLSSLNKNKLTIEQSSENRGNDLVYRIAKA